MGHRAEDLVGEGGPVPWPFVLKPPLRCTVSSATVLFTAMPEDCQRQLAQLWKKAPAGKLSPWSQAKAWALNEVWNELHPDSTYGRNKWIADRLYVEGPGRRHPCNAAVLQFLEKVSEV